MSNFINKLILTSILCLLSLPSYAATLTVGPGQTYTTIQAGVNAAVAGDIVNVLAGTYNETVTTVRSGSAGNYITIQTTAGAAPNRFRVLHSYIKVNGFTLNKNLNCSDGGEEAYIFITGSHIEIANNNISVPSYDTCYGIRMEKASGGNGQPSSLTTDILITGNLVEGSGQTHMDLAGTYITAENNIIRNGIQDAFRTEGCSHCIIRGNEVYDMSDPLDNHVDFVQTFGDNYYGSTDVLIENNYVHDCSNSQPLMLTPDENKIPVDAISGYTLRNNVFTNITYAAQPSINYFKAYNNVFYNVGLTNAGVALHIDCYFTKGMEIKNNIFIGTNFGHSGGYDDDSCSTAQRALFSNDYNHYAQLSTWGTVSEFREAHGTNGGNPLFVNAASSDGDWRLQSGSPAINTGTTIASFAVDKLGVSRPQGAAWDKGAYEYSSGGDTTAPTVTITSPTSSATYSTSSSTVTLAGTASDAVGVTSVTWSNDRGGSGTASCTGCTGTSVTWSQANIALSYGGVNVITFTARDAANNTHTDTLTVSYPPPDTTPPVISNPLPSGSHTCLANPLPTTLQITTDENATCKYGTSNVVYDSLPNTFATTGTTAHSQVINLNCGNSYTYYTRCKDVSDNKSASATTISFSIGASDTTPPTIVSYSPMSQQACTQDPKPIVIQVQTSEPATCKYGTADLAYASLPSTFSSTGGTSHSQNINKACGGVATNYYVRCQDGVGNAMLTSQNIQLSAPVPTMRGQGVVAGGIR